jgi:hypothetical protein
VADNDKEIFNRLGRLETKQATAEYKIDNRERTSEARFNAFHQMLKTVHKEIFGNGDGAIGMDEKFRNMQAQLDTLIDMEKSRRRTLRLLLAAVVGLALDKAFNLEGLASLALRIFG